MIADYAVFEDGTLKAIYEFGSLSCPNKFQFWAKHFPGAEIYWVPARESSFCPVLKEGFKATLGQAYNALGSILPSLN